MVVQLRKERDLEQLLERSKTNPVVIFKHSTQCPISSHAYEEFTEFAEAAEDLTCGLVLVIAAFRGRRLLRRAVRETMQRANLGRYLPAELFASESRPFMDSQRWVSMLRQHGDVLREMAGSQTMAQLPVISAVDMRRFVSDYLAAKHDDGAAVWRLYTTWRWLESLRALRTRSSQADPQASGSWAKLMPTVLKPLST